MGGLERAAASGAKGVKVWKDLGLRVDDAGALLMPDDERLSDVWGAAGELGLPVLIHVADPRFPRFERIVESLEAVVAAHPQTTFVGAHVGCYSEDLAWVSRMLATYPNFNVDVAARIAELGRQPRAARRMILDHPDRVCFGTDEFPPSAEGYAIHFRFLESSDEHFPYSVQDVPPQGRWAISGLDLPDDVLRKVYGDNARRLVPGLG